MMLFTGPDKLAGLALWFFTYAVLHAAGVGEGAFGALLRVLLAALLAMLAVRQLPVDDDGRRLPPAGSTMILMLGFLVLGSAALADALARRAGG